jgi:hypothetical protein
MTYHEETPSGPKRRMSQSLADKLARRQADGRRNWKRSVLSWLLIIAIIIIP